MQVRPLSPQGLLDHVAGLLAARPEGRLRVAVDGAPVAGGAELADALIDPLRVLGRPVLRVRAADFLRPASLRLERGREDPDAFYQNWLDFGALRRELLEPLGPDGDGRYRPRFWDAAADRASRVGYQQAPPGAVVVLDGWLLLGRGLPLDVVVHLSLSAAALARRTPAEQAWTLPAYARYAAQVRPEQVADVVVRVDDARHPALLER